MLKKKFISIALITLIATSMVGCGSNNNASTNNIENTSNNTNSQSNVNIEEPKLEVQKQEQPPILIDQIKVNLSIRKPDSIGTRYVDATLTNNSNMPIKFCNITIKNKDTNENNYFIFPNTIMPKETSPKTDTFAPKSGKKEDIEILKYEFTLVDKNGESIYLDYDVKLKTYEWH